ncbi:MAG: dihydroorotase [Deltaproteobacteria bacterium]|nr:dihydroorotase [Deltaproteobacteria bacterium]
MNRLVIKGGRVLDPAAGLDAVCNIYVMAGRIASIKPVKDDTTELLPGAPGLDIIDATGMLVIPGMIDCHTHLREPGYEYKETIATGAAAAASGGFTAVMCMANTKPVNDSESVTRYILKQAASTGVKVMPIGALTFGHKGERLAEMGELKAAGCVAVSDDGVPVACASIMRRGLEYSRQFNLTVISHAEDISLVGAGVMNEGAVSTRLGLPGIPNAAEDVIIARDISLAELSGGRLHLAHVSTAGGVALIRAAKARGVKVTAEATPHHLTLTDEAVAGYNTFAKMNPPLRTKADCEALIAGVADGTIDCIATDHAPQSVIEKDVEFATAANGIIGLETAFSVIYGLVEAGAFSLTTAVAAMTANPAKAFGLASGALRVGSAADIAIIDLEKTWTVEPSELKSKSKNTPWAGKELKARVMKTIADGKVIFQRA